MRNSELSLVHSRVSVIIYYECCHDNSPCRGWGNKQGTFRLLIAGSFEEVVGVKVHSDLTASTAFYGPNLNPVQSEPICTIVESRDSEGRSSNLIVRTFQEFIGSLKGVRGPREPVDTAVTVQAAGETAVGTAAHLHRQEPHTLHHPAEEAVGGLGGDGIDPLRLDPGDAGQEKEIFKALLTSHDDDEHKKRSRL